MLFDFKLLVLDLVEFFIVGVFGFSKQFFMFGLCDFYCFGEMVIFNVLLCDSDGKLLVEQLVKLEVVQLDGQVICLVMSKLVNGLYQFIYLFDSGVVIGMWYICVSVGDNQLCEWDFYVEDFMLECMVLNLMLQVVLVVLDVDVIFGVSGVYFYGVLVSGNQLQGKLFLCLLCDVVVVLLGFQFGDIVEENFFCSLDEVQLMLDEKGYGEVIILSQWQDSYLLLQVVLQVSLLEFGGCLVICMVKQLIWFVEVLLGICL